eukprot:TRINITY_DN4328_c0_g1_i1.p1 TRINITY_DN4328_c0_g1~~TRINITY_DN4328_c0_g1_i1.p1  ORF type:complete len:340 (+),score=95.65 TRINITY_DN4328_c0_g1_i1:79-1020(+)
MDFKDLRVCNVRTDSWVVNFNNSTMMMKGGVFLGLEPSSSNCGGSGNETVEIKRDVKFRRDWVCGDADFLASCSPKCGDGFTFGKEVCDSGKDNDGSEGCSAICEEVLGWKCEVDETNSTSTCHPVCGDGLFVSLDDCDAHNSDDSSSKRASRLILLTTLILGIISTFILFFVVKHFQERKKKQMRILGKDLTLLEVIGEGRFGKVYRANWRENILVAVKSLKQTENLSKNEIRQFTEEARLFMSVPPHPNIVQFWVYVLKPVNTPHRSARSTSLVQPMLLSNQILVNPSRQRAADRTKRVENQEKLGWVSRL